MAGRFSRPAESDSAEGQGGAASTIKGAAATTAANAARGAVTGGVAGAARAVAVGALKDHNSRKILASILIAIIIIIAMIVMLLASGLNSAVVALLDEQENTNSQTSAEQAGVSEEALDGVESTEHGNVPWPVQAAALDTNPDADLNALEAKLDELDPPRDYRSFTVYATRSAHSAAMIQQLEQNPGKDYYVTLKDYHLQAFQSAGLTDGQAVTAYSLATRISLGEDLCRAEGGGSVDESGGFEYDGQKFDAAQVVNMKTIIGLAKTMAGQNWEAAARIGLITVKVESGFSNYANDGIVGPEDKNMGGFTENDYAKLEYSLTLPHDAVGTDHASVGILQQQATMGWEPLEIPTSAQIRKVSSRVSWIRHSQGQGSCNGCSKSRGGRTRHQARSHSRCRSPASPTSTSCRWRSLMPSSMSSVSSPALTFPPQSAGTGKITAATATATGTLPRPAVKESSTTTCPRETRSSSRRRFSTTPTRAGSSGTRTPPEGYDQIAAYAAGGTISEECTLDPRVLQLIIMGAEMFTKISINSTQPPVHWDHTWSGNALAYHWKGQAADIGALNGKSTTDSPAIAEAHQFWQRFAEVAADSGGGLGQLQCRGGQTYAGVANFDDACNHLHFEIGRDENTTPLKG